MAASRDRIDLDGSTPDELSRGLRLAAIALVSAVLTATVVIGVGGVWLDRSGHMARSVIENPPPLIKTSG